jgi:hypothetical protein
MSEPIRAVIVLDEIKTPHGYVIREEIWPSQKFSCEIIEDAGTPEMMQAVIDGIPQEVKAMSMTTCYTDDGFWIGDEETAKFLCEEKGIKPENRHPEVKPGDLRPCSIGFCEREQKWYGWSHRAIHGFGIGDSVKEGDSAYKPRNEEDFRQKYLEFFGFDEFRKNAQAVDHVEDGVRGALITADYTDDVPNEKLRGTQYRCFWPYHNENFGRGEWTAETLEDARQMACDFAEGVS